MITPVFKEYTWMLVTCIKFMRSNICVFYRLYIYVKLVESKAAFCVQMELFSVKKNSPASGGIKWTAMMRRNIMWKTTNCIKSQKKKKGNEINKWQKNIYIFKTPFLHRILHLKKKTVNIWSKIWYLLICL